MKRFFCQLENISSRFVGASHRRPNFHLVSVTPSCHGVSRRWFSNDNHSASHVNYSSLSSDINKAFHEQRPKTTENMTKTSEKFDEIMSRIRSINVDDNAIPQSLVYEICYFMTQYHTTKALNLGSINPDTNDASTNILNFKEMQNKDLLVAWSLLENSMKNLYSASDNSSSNSESSFNHSNIDILKVEIATRLEDSIKLKMAFIELLSKKAYSSDESQKIESLLTSFTNDNTNETVKNEVIACLSCLSNDEMMIAFTTVPYLGMW